MEFNGHKMSAFLTVVPPTTWDVDLGDHSLAAAELILKQSDGNAVSAYVTGTHLDENGKIVVGMELCSSKGGSVLLRGLADGINDGDAVTKRQLDSLINSVCPELKVAGRTLVQCYPMPGTLLDVRVNSFSSTQKTRVVHCGKNLYPYNGGKPELVSVTSANGTTVDRWGFALKLPAGTYTIHAEAVGNIGSNDRIYGMTNDQYGTYRSLCRTVKDGQILDPVTITTKYNETIFIYCNDGTLTQDAAQAMLSRYNLQIEAGSVVTPFEKYIGVEYQTPVQVVAHAGVNTLHSYANTYYVTGKAEPAKYMNDLKNAILSLGGNV